MASLATSLNSLSLDEAGTSDEKSLNFTTEELQTFQQVTEALLKDERVTDEEIQPREVAIVTMLSKGRVDKTVEKYVQFLAVLKEYDLTMLSLYEDVETLRTKGITDKFNSNYQVCGRDKGGRSIMWISSSKPAQISEEQITVHSGILYWMAVHSDLHTMREGCTFVIDTSKQSGISKVGNEKKLQKTWQSLPLRPQNLFIVGAGWFKRLAINALIAFASIFSNSKVLARIRFVEMPEVRTEVPDESMPEELGGQKRSTVEEWAMERLSLFENFSFAPKGETEEEEAAGDDVSF